MVTQSGRRQLLLAIELGGAQIRIERVEAVEALARPFSIVVDLYSTLGEIDLLPHLGQPACVTVNQDDVLMRYFHGHIVEGEYLSERNEGHHYRLVLRPWTHLLSQNRNYAIFQGKTTIEIIQDVLKISPFADIECKKISGQGRKREYCVQYGESDFAFITRLLEEEGIYYYFEHAADRHTLVLCDRPASHPTASVPKLVFNHSSASLRRGGSDARIASGGIHTLFRWNERVVTGGEAKVTLRDFDFETPTKPVEAKTNAHQKHHPLDALEIYQWPAHTTVPTDVSAASKVMLDARRAGRQTYSGETELASIMVGHKFTVTKHLATPRFNRGYMVTRTHHMLSAEQYRSGSSEQPHMVHFEAVPDTVAWHAPQVSPRPVVMGPETAIVTGPSGEDIYTDKYGRVKVRFHWDRSTTTGDKSTCWIRVSQTGGLGNIILPRIGHEVLVDFLDGDPDRPIIVGRVFNGKNMPIYELPKHQTRALWRTKSMGKGSDDVGKAKALSDTGNPGANELRFEDQIGKEEVFIHAQRDLNTRVRRSETHNLGLDQTIDMGGARKVTITETDSNEVGKSIKIKAGTTIEIEAQTSITFKVGQTKMVLDQTSVSIKTSQMTLEAQATADVKSPMTTVKGDGMLTLKGGVTMINS